MSLGEGSRINLSYDSSAGELYHKGISCELTTRNLHSKLRKRLMNLIGKPIKTILYKTGRKTGLSLAKYHEDLSVLSEYGWGIPRVSDEKIEVLNSHTSLNYDSDEPVCQLLEGFFAGWFSQKEREKIGYKEVKCRAVGDDRCVFKRREEKVPVEDPNLTYEKEGEFQDLKIKFDEEKGLIKYRNNYSLLVPRGFTSIFQNELEGVVGPASGREMYKVVKDISVESVKKEIGFGKYLLFLPNRIIAEPVIKMGFRQLRERGFGNVELIDFDASVPRIKVKVENSYNAHNATGKEEPFCDTLSGVLAGGSKAIFSQDMESEEIECIAHGDDACVFEITPSNT